MADWGGTKTDWTPDKGPLDSDMNRIEENVQHIYERLSSVIGLAKFSAGNIALYTNHREIKFHWDSFPTKYIASYGLGPVVIGNGGTIRVSFDLRASGWDRAYGRILVNRKAIKTVSTDSRTYRTFTNDISVNAGDEIVIVCRSADDDVRTEACITKFIISVERFNGVSPQ